MPSKLAQSLALGAYTRPRLFNLRKHLKIMANSSLVSKGVKSQIAPTGLSTIASYSGIGVLRKLWLAFNGSGNAAGNTFLRIYVDGVLTVGNLSVNTALSGVNTIPLATDLLMAPLGGPFFANSLQACNVYTANSLGGYVTLDAPFASNITVQLYNNSGSPITFWVQPFIEKLPAYTPNLKLYSSTFRYLNTTYGNEYMLLNVPDNGNGVYLSYIRMHVIGASGNWWESRVRIYDALNSPTNTNGVISPWTPYNALNYTSFDGFDASSNCIFASSGLEDFYLTSWNGVNLTSFNNTESGLLYQSTPSIVSNTTISFYRNFGCGPKPSVGPGRRMVMTVNSGDAQIGQSGSMTAIIGQAFYYA